MSANPGAGVYEEEVGELVKRSQHSLDTENETTLHPSGSLAGDLQAPGSAAVVESVEEGDEEAEEDDTYFEEEE